MTEDEAKTKWCPFIQVSRSDGLTSTNRDGLGREPDEAHCMASECMAWRWSLHPKLSEQYRKYNERGVTIPERHGRPWPEVARGFCGLAGKP